MRFGDCVNPKQIGPAYLGFPEMGQEVMPTIELAGFPYYYNNVRVLPNPLGIKCAISS